MSTTLSFRPSLVLSLILILSGCGIVVRNAIDGYQYVSRGGLQYPGRLGPLEPQEKEWARIAWRYFENNSTEQTGLVNSVDKYPVLNAWQLGDILIALTAAEQLELISKVTFDQRLAKILATLDNMPLTRGKVPNKTFSVKSGNMVDYASKPAETGWSAIDIGRLLLSLKIVGQFYPEYREYLDKMVLRWNYCSLLDNDGQLLSAYNKQAGFPPVPEGRLGYSEYSASGFTLWGFLPGKSTIPPYETTLIYNIPIDFDARDPRTNQQNNPVLSMPYLLSGIEFNWKAPGNSKEYQQFQQQRGQRIYQVQEARWKIDKIYTARTDHLSSPPPNLLYDSIFANGYPWNSIGDDNKEYPEKALVATKAVFGMWVLWNTEYTDQLMKITRSMYDAKRGWYEGRYEKSGAYDRTITLSTNALVLEALLYKHNFGSLFRTHDQSSYYYIKLQDVFSLPNQCTPPERTETEDRGR